MEIGGEKLRITEVEDRWYSPGMTYFRVVVEGGDRYVLKHMEAQDFWVLEGFRASGFGGESVDTKFAGGV